MERVKVTLEVVTPMLSFGDDRKISEFRITELKSLMRNIFRELYYFKDSREMKEKEGTLFGNMDRKSPIRFKIIGGEQRGKKHAFMLPHKPVTDPRKKDREKARTSCLGYSRKIDLYMIMNSDLKIDLYVILLIQASIIGGLGKRSRKGFGSFKVIDIDGIENNEYKDILEKNPIEILKECDDWLKKSYSNNYNTRKNNYEAAQLIFSDKGKADDLDFPYVIKVYFVRIKSNKDYIKLIEDISKLTHNRLPNREDDKNDFTYGIKNRHKIRRNILGNCSCETSKVNRFASPVSVSFWENSNHRYMVIKILNYKYILSSLDIKGSESIKANEDYINKYIKKLDKIGDAKK